MSTYQDLLKLLSSISLPTMFLSLLSIHLAVFRAANRMTSQNAEFFFSQTSDNASLSISTSLQWHFTLLVHTFTAAINIMEYYIHAPPHFKWTLTSCSGVRSRNPKSHQEHHSICMLRSLKYYSVPYWC